MTDIAPELIEEIRTKFQTAMMKDRELRKASVSIQNGSSDCSDVLTYADEIGAALQAAVADSISEEVLPDGVLYYNIVERLVNEVFSEAYDLAEDAAEHIMKSINNEAGIGLKVQGSDSKKDRLSDLIESVAGEKYTGRNVTDFLSAARSCPMTAAEDVLSANAEFQSSVGRSPTIKRIASAGACETCVELAGEYEYPGVNKRVFWRHGSCRCTVEYHPGDGTVQNAHTKQWTRQSENDKIEARKTVGIDDAAKVIQARINKGEYSQELSHQQYLKHVLGSSQYSQYERDRKGKGQSPPSYLVITEEEAQRLVNKYSGKGTPRVTKKAEVANVEYVTSDITVGYYCSSNGEWLSTRRAAIHYGSGSCHIVPVSEARNG